jgi:hypothetical protein
MHGSSQERRGLPLCGFRFPVSPHYSHDVGGDPAGVIAGLESSAYGEGKERDIMIRSFTVLALCGCAALSATAAGTNRDLRAQHTKDARVYVTLQNKSSWFREVMIDGHKYTVLPGDLLAVTAPAGTTVYAASPFGRYQKGEAFLKLTPSMDHLRVPLN